LLVFLNEVYLAGETQEYVGRQGKLGTVGCHDAVVAVGGGVFLYIGDKGSIFARIAVVTECTRFDFLLV
jgi:hypothetical protein